MTEQPGVPIETTLLPRAGSTPAALLPVVTDEAARCWRCHKKMFEHATRPWEIICQRCGATNASAPAAT